MKFAFADPPYLGCCSMYGHYHGDGNKPWDGRCWDDIATHTTLIHYLAENYDGWAYIDEQDELVDLFPGTGGMSAALATPPLDFTEEPA